VEEECLQTLVEDRKWRRWLDIYRQCVSEYGRGDGKRTTTDGWQMEWWNVQLMLLINDATDAIKLLISDNRTLTLMLHHFAKR